MRKCAFCLVNETTATLADGTAICWRPCYAALNYIKAGAVADIAVLRAFEDVPYGVSLMREMNEAGVDPRGLCDRLLRGAYGVNIQHLALPSGSAA